MHVKYIFFTQKNPDPKLKEQGAMRCEVTGIEISILIGPTHITLSTRHPQRSKAQTMVPSPSIIRKQNTILIPCPSTLTDRLPSLDLPLHSTMAMATQASLFTPAPKSGDRVAFPWKQSSSLAFTGLKTRKFSRMSIRAAAEGAEAPPKEEAPVGFTPPELDPNTPSPIFGGSTGGLLRKAQVNSDY